ncbi:hypothetical protein IW140_004329 [Coemansia sp. RSA 1813]|nr:hypothetical protein EV178_004401 [Coemansia sp. RSA 1646]KAJ1769410.1 hypothetical protein LPJ74_004073 [Coemansia sp. RSA 1843]KAJ2087981.1 hypothetical protein IW138_004578 [Coemansia sp. RSA 986]KAJ2211323.1 hypothetical protein EV179_005590 [Coemansia sp. RSA 487]KAJ2567819.1 hypothetical protein IW140_004329 [Coemansia sp. RSA 1813]
MASNHPITRASTVPSLHIPLAAAAPPPAPQRILNTRRTMPAVSPGAGALNLSLDMGNLRKPSRSAPGTLSQQQRTPLTPLDSTRARRLPVVPLSTTAMTASKRAPVTELACDDESVTARRAARTYRNGPQLIMPYLYLGGESNVASDQLHGLGIGHVLNVAREASGPASLGATADLSREQPVRYRHYEWDHNEPDLARFFSECFEFIDAARMRHQSILVHCQLGVSRSASLVIAYVMRTMRMGFAAAYEYVRLRAPCISPNLSLISQLHEYGAALGAQGGIGDGEPTGELLRANLMESPPPPELAPPSSTSSSENASPVEDLASGRTLCSHVLLPPHSSPMLTSKPADGAQNPLALKIVASRHPLVPQ